MDSDLMDDQPIEAPEEELTWREWLVVGGAVGLALACGAWLGYVVAMAWTL